MSLNDFSDITVVVFEGAHGVGKTTAVKHLNKLGFGTIKEDFLDNLTQVECPRALFEQLKWCGNWFEKVVSSLRGLREREQIHGFMPYLYIDRCPLTSAMYNLGEDLGSEILSVIEHMMLSFCETYNIKFNLVILDCSWDSISHRISRRLNCLREHPSIRETLLERDPSHYEVIRERYQDYANGLWNRDIFSDLSVVPPSRFPPASPQYRQWLNEFL